ncbi:phage tail protein [Gilvimarinus polysaccharolyticus]|uniref:phage tail protein n=1 Tax=Gilvimarinus polysaccharolyticus TaxID=863921 RepID=UPI0006734F26|nr:tail fiber protein [Gilvimarinus polysaccharolyticus]
MIEVYIGEIRMVGFDFVPRGWARCDGSLIAISSNTALFSLLGTRYGGDGVNSFGLPDYRSRSPVGIGHGPGLSVITQGEKSGLEYVNMTTSNLPAHTHTASQLKAAVAIPGVTSSTSVSGTPSVNSILGPVTASDRAGAIYSTDTSDVTLRPFDAHVTGQTDMSGGGQPLPIRNPFLGTNFIIALEGIFPSRS